MQAKSKLAATSSADLESPVAKKLPRRRSLNWVILVAIVLAALVWWWTSGESASEAQPLIVEIEIGDIENAVTAAGTLQPSELIEVGAQVSGQLQKLYVDAGDSVEAGQLVAEIDATVQSNRVEASRASLQALEAQLSARESALKLAQANAARQTRLMEDDASTQADFDQAMNSLASAQSSYTQLQSQIAQSKASLASDEAQLGYTKIYAPISGTIVAIDRKEGVTLNANQQTPVIMRIADLSTMTVEAEVSEADVTKLSTGMEVYFTTLGSGDRRWYSKLRQVLPTPVVTNNVVLYSALFDVDNADQALLSSMTAQVFFITSSARNVAKVPVGALHYADDAGRPSGAAASFTRGERRGPREGGVPPTEEERAQRRAARLASGGGPRAGADFANRRQRGGRGAVATVQLALDDGTFEEREVRVGVTSRIAAEVLSGLEAGDRVVAGVVQSGSGAQNTQNRDPRFGPRF
tara:strand:+ start:27754 stop:29157 length:1404 start_codon:yes stop_codon:yes gene_type:complete